jgi:hypothetical protein
MAFKQRLKKHLINLRGEKIKDKLLVIESDDWGSIRIPNKEVQKKLIDSNHINVKDPFSAYDCLESEEDFNALFEVLKRHKDKNGTYPVFTANMVMGNPDFEKIKQNNFDKFEWEPFFKTYQEYYPTQKTFEKLKEGIREGFVFPQFHAREHLNAYQWMLRLREKNEFFLNAFDCKCFAIDDHNRLNNRANLMASYDYKTEEELNQLKSSITEGLFYFKDVFGFNSKTTIAPCYVWNQEIERIFKANDIESIQSSYVQQQNEVKTGKLRKVWHVNGTKNSFGQYYFVRNVLFEPSLDPNLDWVEKALESIDIAFFWGKPAIISTHRINYVAGLSTANRVNSLRQLNELITKVMKKWPNIKFVNSSQILDHSKVG